MNQTNGLYFYITTQLNDFELEEKNKLKQRYNINPYNLNGIRKLVKYRKLKI